MKGRSILITGAAVIFLIFALCIIAGCISPKTTNTTIPVPQGPATSLTMNTQAMPTYSGRIPVPTLSEGSNVTMVRNDFKPRTLVVLNGTTVTWTNEDESRNYSVVSDNLTAASFQSGTLLKGGVFSFKFSRPGTYLYHSSVPPEINGEIVVR